jgi:hypothetical protein
VQLEPGAEVRNRKKSGITTFLNLEQAGGLKKPGFFPVGKGELLKGFK